MVMYTSGTTGRAKGVLHSHNTLHALIQQLGKHWHIEKGDAFLVPSPISHIGGSIYAFECPLLLGSRAVLMEAWQPEPAIDLMEAERCTHMAGATPFLEQLLAAARAKGTRLEQLKTFICGGAAVPPQLIQEAANYFPNACVTRVYGSTEVPVTTVGAPLPNELEFAATTDGRAGIASIKLIENAAAAPGEGEICAKGPQMLLGYLHAEDDARSFDDEGYFRTGDIGRYIGDYIQVTGRAKDIIISGGENISSVEVEGVLMGHPDVNLAAVVAKPDEKWGEVPCAFVELKAGAVGDEAAMIAFARETLAGFKTPKKIVFQELPKTSTGKIQKFELRAQAARL